MGGGDNKAGVSAFKADNALASNVRLLRLQCVRRKPLRAKHAPAAAAAGSTADSLGKEVRWATLGVTWQVAGNARRDTL